MKLLTWVILLFIISFVGYLVWTGTGKDYSALPDNRDRAIELITQGNDQGKGNLIGFQPYFTPVDYCDEKHFRDALYPFFVKAKSEGLLQPHTIVVLPENTGSWLALSNEKATVYQSDSLIHAIAIIVNSHIFTFLPRLFITRKADLIRYAFFDMKARSMADAYQRVFSSLAMEFKVSIVAGSIILPHPSVDKRGRIRFNRGNLCNAAFVFGPDGKVLHQPILKTHLSPDEKQFITPGKVQDDNVFKTPSGSLAVLVGADGWSTGAYKNLRADILAIPSFSEATSSQAINQRIRNTVKAGRRGAVAVFYSGNLWEMDLDGKALSLQKDSVNMYPSAMNKGRILNVWLTAG